LGLLGALEGKPPLQLTMHCPGFDRFEVEGKLVWSNPKGNTSIVGIQFTKIDQDHAKQLTHMAEAYWECEDRIRTKAPIVGVDIAECNPIRDLNGVKEVVAAKWLSERAALTKIRRFSLAPCWPMNSSRLLGRRAASESSAVRSGVVMRAGSVALI